MLLSRDIRRDTCSLTVLLSNGRIKQYLLMTHCSGYITYLISRTDLDYTDGKETPINM